jgi:cardiolipin synthase
MFRAMTLPPLDLGTAYAVANWTIRIGAVIVVPFKRRFTAAAWLLLLFFLPIPGLILFLLIGQPKFPKGRVEKFRDAVCPFFHRVGKKLAPLSPREPSPIAELAQRLGFFPAVGGNQIELIGDYDGAIQRLIADIDAAKSRVFILAYIFADDEIGLSIIDALGRAVKRGVDCRVLVDPVGSSHWIRGTERCLRQAGVKYRAALPWHWLRRRTRRDMRNHRKLFVIDGRIGYSGSQNIVCRDFRPGVVNRELVARCTGPIVAEMEAQFFGDWFLETGIEPQPIEPADADGEALLQLLPSGAEYPLAGFETLLVWQLHQARRHAVIVTPYFIPDEDVLDAMRTTAARGVEVHLVLSQVVDQRVVNLAQRSYYDGLLSAGVRIHLFRDFLLHAKNVGIDGKLGILGSSNVDLRSFQLNEEVSLLLLDDRSAQTLADVQRSYIEDSEELRLEEWRKRGRPAMVLENLARLISPLL